MSKTLHDLMQRQTSSTDEARLASLVSEWQTPKATDNEPRDAERLAALELGTTVESIDQKLMVAYNRAEKAEAIAAGVRSAHLLEKIAHADTKLALWKERYNRSGEMMDKIHRERDDLQAESRGENPRWIAPERGR